MDDEVHGWLERNLVFVWVDCFFFSFFLFLLRVPASDVTSLSGSFASTLVISGDRHNTETAHTLILSLPT